MNDEITIGYKRVLGFVVGVLFALVFPLLPVRAQQPDQQMLQVEGLGISPFLIEVDVEPGKSSLNRITLTNTSDQPLPVDISIQDFVPNEHGDGASFLESGQQSDPRFSIAEWITIVKQPQFIIEPRQQTTVEFTIEPPAEAEPGTHYGGILFSYRHRSVEDASVTVTQKAGTLVLANLGVAHQLGSITNFHAQPSLDFGEVKFLLSFYNQGNVHVKPKGELQIENMLGRQVGSVLINKDAAIVLPEAQRSFEGSWKPGWRFGRYTAQAVMYYGNPKLEARAVVHFWIIPWQHIVMVALVAVLVLFGGYKGIKRYNIWLLSRVTRN